jgi:hypothetical protein
MLFSKPCRFILFFAYLLSANAEDSVDLGTAGEYTILTKAGISTVPDSSITGNIAVSPIAATAMTGFALTAVDVGKASESTQVSGRAYAASYIAPTPAHLTTAIGDMEIAYDDAAGRIDSNAIINLGSGEIGGETLTAGLYTFDADVTINSDVTITGTDTDIFIIQMMGDLMLATDTKVTLVNVKAENIFWQIAGSVKVETNAEMKGILLVKTHVLFETGSTLIGRVLAQTRCDLQKATIKPTTD